MWESTHSPEHRRILVTGATGKQGGGVVKALLNLQPSDFEILALTRNTSSAAAKALAENENVKLIAGDLDNISDVFEVTGGIGSIWGVFSVQVPHMGKDGHSDENREYRQGVDLIDASIKYGVQHFVQTSVDRGGPDSDNSPTKIPHFITKHRIELHLKEKVKDTEMTYTILRPVAFMDMFQPTLTGRVFAAALGNLGDKPLQFVATKDIGIFAAKAFESSDSDDFKNAAISLAGDELTQKGCNDAFWKGLNRPMPVAYGFMGKLLLWAIADVGLMFQWFADVGYGANISKCREMNPDMLDLPTYLKQESSFTSSA